MMLIIKIKNCKYYSLKNKTINYKILSQIKKYNIIIIYGVKYINKIFITK